MTRPRSLAAGALAALLLLGVGAGRAAAQVPAAVRAPTPTGPPPDSVRPAAPALPQAPPADAVAQCRDGTFLKAPAAAAACATHGGLIAAMPARTAPPARPVAVTPEPVLLRPADQSGPPPDGATMRCKDGTYLSGAPDASRCAANGGLAAVLPAPKPTPAPPAHQRKP